MFRRGRSKPASAGRNLHNPGRGDDLESTWESQVKYAREVIASAFPGELELFEEIAAEFRADPAGVVGEARLRAPVGAGVDLALVAPYVLSAISFLFAAVSAKAADRAADAAIDKLGRSTREKLSVLLRKRRPGSAEENQLNETTGESAEPGAMAWLDAAQERELYAVLRARALAEGLPQERADRMAEAVLGALRLRGGSDKP
jgi:hypothetical protein